MMRIRQCFLGFASLLALLAPAPPSAAQAPPRAPAAAPQAPAPPQAADDALDETARELFLKGTKAWDQGKFDQCRAALLAAWSIKPHPQIAVNLGGCELKLGLHRDAAEHLAYFLREAPAGGPPERRAEAQKLLAEASAKLTVATIDAGPPGAEVLLDGKVVGTAPLPGPLFLEDGEHVLEARAEGRVPEQTKVLGKAGWQVSLMLYARPKGAAPQGPAGPVGPKAPEAPKAPVAPEAPPQGALAEEDSRTMVPAFVLGGVAAVGLISGVALLAGAGGKRSDAEQLHDEILDAPGSCVIGAGNYDAMRCPALEETATSADALHNVGVAALVGGVLAGAGAAVYVFLPAIERNVLGVEQGRARSRWIAVPTGDTRGGGLVVRGAF